MFKFIKKLFNKKPMQNSNTIRRAAHAGSWYDKNPNQLGSKLRNWINQVSTEVNPSKLKAIIGPHAGYDFCGHIGAYGYKFVEQQKTQYKTVFLLGPSHKIYLEGCALSPCTTWETP